MKRVCLNLNTNRREKNHASSIRPLKISFVRMKRISIYITLGTMVLLLLSCQKSDLKKNQIINFDYFAPHNISEGSFVLKAKASSGLPVTFTSSDTAIATINDSIISLVKPGEVNITASQLGNETFYQAGKVTRTLTINDDINSNKRNQTITFILNDTLWKVSQGYLPLNATSTSGLTVKFTSSNVAYASINGDYASSYSGNYLVVESGALDNNDYVTVTASQSGDYVYNAAPPVAHTLRVYHDVH